MYLHGFESPDLRYVDIPERNMRGRFGCARGRARARPQAFESPDLRYVDIRKEI